MAVSRTVNEFESPNSASDSQSDVASVDYQAEDNPTLDVLTTYSPVLYTIPGFSVITVELRPVKVILSLPDHSTAHVHVFMREDEDILSHVPGTVEVLETCTVDPAEFCQCVDITDFILPNEGVRIIWKWCWTEGTNEAGTAETQSQSGSEVNDSTDEAAEEDQAAHEVVFKCIGATKSRDYQIVLKKARDLIIAGHHVPVKLCPEPSNPYNSKAIAFQCNVDGKFYRIGYVIDEIVSEVHNAMDQHAILSVEFSWIRYITEWSRSGPGFFAGIAVTKSGQWPACVVRASSTK